MVINSIKLQDPGAFCSVCILPTMYPVTCSYYVTIWPWPLTLINNWHLPLIMVINFTKLYDPGAYGSFHRGLLPLEKKTPIDPSTYNYTLVSFFFLAGASPCGSFCIPHTAFSFFVTIRPWPLTLKNNRHLFLTMLIKCTIWLKSDPLIRYRYTSVPCVAIADQRIRF